MAVIREDEEDLGLESSFAQVQEVLVWVALRGGRDMKGSQCPGISHGLSEEVALHLSLGRGEPCWKDGKGQCGCTAGWGAGFRMKEAEKFGWMALGQGCWAFCRM